MAKGPSDYTVEEIDPRDCEAVAAAYEAAWSGDPEPPLDIRRRCDWLYLANPAGRARILVLRSPTGDAVGMQAVAPRTFWINRSPRTLGLLCDLVVHKDHRSRLPALQLLRATRACADHEGWPIYAVPNERALRTFRQLDQNRYVDRPRVARPLRHRGYLSPRLGFSAAPVAWGLDALANAWDTLNSIGSGRHGVESPDEIDVTAHDALWQRVMPAVCMGERSGRFLRWRFWEEPDRRSRMLTIARSGDYGLAGYAIATFDNGHCSIRDLLIDSDSIPPRPALALLLRAARDLGSLSVSFRVRPDDAIARAFRTLGLREREHETVVWYGDAREQFARSHFTRADEDV
ncbi:MAG: hypothetical protein U1F08_06390 [Steroidobacteraceae bacterium]